MISNWKTKEIKKIGDYRIFSFNSAVRTNPSSGLDSEFYFLNTPNWVNVIPITKDNKIIFVEQYRHGTDSVTLEVPAGLIEPSEAPRSAAERECLEETGYSSIEPAELLGVNSPNPAFLNNKCYSYLLKNCEKTFEQNLDSNEVIDVHFIEPLKVKEMIHSGEINHSLVLTAFFFYSLKYGF